MQPLFLWSAVAFAAGIGLYFGLAVEPPIALGILAWLGGFGLFLWYRQAALLPLVLLTGFLAAQAQTIRVAGPVLARDISYTSIEGRIRSMETREDGSTRLILDHLTLPDVRAVPLRLRLTVRGQLPDLYPGDRIRTNASLRPPPGPVEPGSYDPARVAWFERVGAYGVALDQLTLMERDETSFSLKVATLRLGIADRIRKKLAGPEGGLAVALVTGLRGGVPPAVTQAMRESGLAHLLAISGLHMGLLCGGVFFVLRLALAAVPPLARQVPIKKLAAVAALITGGAYLLLAGAPISTQRAFVMAGLSLVAILVDRRAISLRLLAIAAFLTLALNPAALTTPGFQMSFAAVLALVAFHERVGSRLPRAVGETGSALAWVRRGFLYLGGVLLTTVIAEVAIGPIALFHFNQVTSYGLIANLVAVPVMAFWVMPLLLVSMCLMPLGWEGIALEMAGAGLSVIIGIASEVANWPGAVTAVAQLPAICLPLFALALVLLCLGRGAIVRSAFVIPLLLAIMAADARPRPLVWVDGQAGLFAIAARAAMPAFPGQPTASTRSDPEKEGGLYLSDRRRGRFASTVWAENAGLPERRMALPQRPQLLDGGWHLACDKLGCRLSGRQMTLDLILDPAGQDLACQGADRVVSLTPWRRTCLAPSQVSDFFDLQREGPLRLDDRAGKLTVRTVKQTRGQRPWSGTGNNYRHGQQTARDRLVSTGNWDDENDLTYQPDSER